jgi:hypothetical protein
VEVLPDRYLASLALRLQQIEFLLEPSSDELDRPSASGTSPGAGGQADAAFFPYPVAAAVWAPDGGEFERTGIVRWPTHRNSPHCSASKIHIHIANG